VSYSLADRFAGALLGVAIGDAIGAPVEGRPPDEIRARFDGPVQGFVEPWAPRPDGRVKGHGHVTDDTLMTVALAQAYLSKRGLIEPHDLAEHLIPLLADRPTFVPEYGRDMLLVERLFHPEKYLVLRLRIASADPREAGVGNAVNCGAAMYFAPVGLMHAGDPLAAYADAVALAGAHQNSYGREAAAIIAACIAEAVRPNASWRSVVDLALALAKDGTRAAIAAVVATAERLQDQPHDSLEVALALRNTIEPFDTVKGRVGEHFNYSHYPSRTHAIEEVPAALGYLVQTQGDVRRAIVGAANYGRDADSTAGMVGGIAAALGGASALPPDWIERVEQANRLPLTALAGDLFGLWQHIYASERERADRRVQELGSQLSTPVGNGRYASGSKGEVRS
jgi:ADP-ribosylglycohydrolase